MSESLQIRSLEQLKSLMSRTEIFATNTSKQQNDIEESVKETYDEQHVRMREHDNLPYLHRDRHKRYLLENLFYLPERYEKLDASRPWLCYWIVHSLSLMGVKLEDSNKSKIAKFLEKCQSRDGGFGGGPGQFPHLAPTYAAVNTLITLGTVEAYNVINREKLLQFLWSVRQQNGSFAMHVGGEIDIRGTYCALAVASITNIISSGLIKNTAEWIVSCQTYEGGFAGCPGMEAHGGYTFCGIAGLVILGKSHLCDRQSLLRWLVNRQMKFEGGFQGRTNKLVDGCYSFWQGASFPIIYSIMARDGITIKKHLFNEAALQEYILFCCQYPSGGLIDKPGKGPDMYHTCYTISGLSIAQHLRDKLFILGPKDNEIEMIHPLYNIRVDYVQKALLHFNELVIL